MILPRGPELRNVVYYRHLPREVRCRYVPVAFQHIARRAMEPRVACSEIDCPMLSYREYQQC